MAILITGNTITFSDLTTQNTAAGSVEVSQATGNGACASYSIGANAPGSENNTWVFLNGVYQQKTSYTISGTTITLDTNVPTGVVLEVCSGTSRSILAPSDGTVNTATLVDGAVTTVKIDSMANTKITGVITAAQIDTVANTQVTGLITAAQLASGIAFPSSTIMTFQQTAAPTGWTKLTTHNDKAFRVVSGSASSGGSVAFTTAFASQAVAGTNASGAVSAHTLTTAEMPSHDHSLPRYTVGGGYQAPDDISASAVGAYEGLPSSSTGGGGSHDHNFTQPTFSGTAINLAVSYIDLILAQKD